MSYSENIEHLVASIKPERGLEVGLHEGLSARAFLRGCEGRLTSIDHNHNFGSVGDRHDVITGDSSKVMKGLKPNTYDYIYIDGDHSYEGCKADIEAAIPLLKKNGVLVMDDYGVEGSSGGVTWDINGVCIDGVYGVKRAADELLKGWKVLPYELANGGKAYTRE